MHGEEDRKRLCAPLNPSEIRPEKYIVHTYVGSPAGPNAPWRNREFGCMVELGPP